MSTKKSSGYLTTDELSKTLGLPLEGDLFVSLLKRIRQISQQILNPHETYDNQENEKIAEISAKMSQEFPDVLQSPTLSPRLQRERMKAVLLYCSQFFRSHRTNLLKKEKKAHIPSLSTPPQTRGVKKNNKVQSRRIPTPSPTLRSTSLKPSQRARTPCTPSPAGSQYATNASRSGTVGEKTSPDTPSPLPSTSSSTTLALRPYSALIARYQPRKPEASVSDVAEFLGTCDPDMRYLLPSFMAFGCRNVEFLINISCQKEEDIETILRKITKHCPPVEGIEEMDLLVVTKHFKEYFFGGSKKPLE